YSPYWEISIRISILRAPNDVASRQTSLKPAKCRDPNSSLNAANARR
ncbi:hypothetical protein AVEN_272257-1, partial [Araneus ventricosus]